MHCIGQSNVKRGKEAIDKLRLNVKSLNKKIPHKRLAVRDTIDWQRDVIRCREKSAQEDELSEEDNLGAFGP